MAKTNLHPSYCPGCRKDMETLVEMGQSDRVYNCRTCLNYYTGAVWPGKCPVCDALSGQQRYIKTLDPGEAVPGEICIDCMAKQDLIDQAVKDGGVRFQCIGCGKDGVFSSATPFAQRVREETKKPAPHDVFVQIKVCPQCSPVPETEPELEDHQAVGEMEDAIMSASTNLAQEVEDES